ncbi:MAG TPA: zf-HC2 domain-containing protein [Acidobacteriota bacterium]|nr:zf-HC2 domain-containing protein [Acidobacteriota bacterium]
MNACQCLPDVSALKDGELTAQEELRLRRHLDGCAICASEWRRLEKLSALLHDVPVDHVAGRRIRRTIRRDQAWFRRPLPLPTGIAAGLLMALGLSLIANLWMLAPPGPSFPSAAASTQVIQMEDVDGVAEFNLEGLKGFRVPDRPAVSIIQYQEPTPQR